MTRRLLALAALYLCIVLTAAVVFDIAEGHDMWNSLWWAIVTATTVGYGDLSPSTITGRLVAILLMHSTTLLLLPLLTAEIAAKLIVDSDAFTHEEQEAIKQSLAKLEAMVSRLESNADGISNSSSPSGAQSASV